MLRISLFAIALLTTTAANAVTTPEPKPSSCKVNTFNADGYLATVQTGDGRPLTFTEAVEIVKLLNDRHNNGNNPVLAKLDCS